MPCVYCSIERCLGPTVFVLYKPSFTSSVPPLPLQIPRFLRYPLWKGFLGEEKVGDAYTAAAQRGVLGALAVKHTAITQRCQEALDLALAPPKARAAMMQRELALAGASIVGASDVLGSASHSMVPTYSSKDLAEMPASTITARPAALALLRDSLSFLASRTDPGLAAAATSEFAAYRALPCALAVIHRDEEPIGKHSSSLAPLAPP